MELSELKAFVAVCELGSFSRAAVALGLGQPSITRIIRNLEEDLAGELFHRTGRGAQLTSLGEMVLPRVKAVLQSTDQMTVDAVSFGRSPTGLVSIAALPSLLQTLAPALYGYISKSAPGIRLRMSEGFSNQVQGWVAEGTVDIGLFSRYKSRPENAEVLFRADLMLVGPIEPNRNRKEVTFSELKGLPLILPALPNGLRAVLEESARKHKVELNVVVEADSLAAQKQIVRACGCYTVMAREAAASMNSDESLSFVRIVGKGLDRYVVLLTTQQRPLSKAARVVAQAIKHIVHDRRQAETLPALAQHLAGAAKEAKRQRR